MGIQKIFIIVTPVYLRINFTILGSWSQYFFYLIDAYFHLDYNYDNSDPVTTSIIFAGLLANMFTYNVTGIVYDA